MAIWKATPVDETPEIVISRWTVREIVKSELLPTGNRHIVGWNVTEGEARVSSNIVSFDIVHGIAMTQSGRKYKLRADPALNIEAEYVFQAWCRINKVEESKDVSDEYYEESIEGVDYPYQDDYT